MAPVLAGVELSVPNLPRRTMKCTHWGQAARGLLLLLATCVSGLAQAQGERIGLVLGGGGAEARLTLAC